MYKRQVYKVTHAAADVCIFNNAYVFAAAIVILADALLAIEPVAAFADVLDEDKDIPVKFDPSPCNVSA